MVLFKKSRILFPIPSISRQSLIQLWGAMSQAFLQSIHATARLVCLFLQSLNTVLSMSSRSFVSRLPLRHAFCSDGGTFSLTSDYTSFQLTFQSLLSTSGAGRILVYSYQLHFFAGSFWHSTVFPKVIQSGKGLSPSRI